MSVPEYVFLAPGEAMILGLEIFARAFVAVFRREKLRLTISDKR